MVGRSLVTYKKKKKKKKLEAELIIINIIIIIVVVFAVQGTCRIQGHFSYTVGQSTLTLATSKVNSEIQI